MLIVNPIASGVTASRIAAVMGALAEGGPTEQILTERAGHATEIVRECGDCAAIYVLAGDGGFNEAVNGAVDHVPFGFIPGGATSVLPRALGLPADPVACARRIARADRTRRISLGRVTHAAEPGGRRFTFSAGFGLDAELMRAVDSRGREGGKRAGDLAAVSELASILWQRQGRIEPRIEIEGRGRCAFALVANCNPYTYLGPLPVRVAPRAAFHLGLDLIALRKLRTVDLPRLAWWVLAHPVQERSANVIAVHDADRIVLRCDDPVPMQIDGEDLGDVTAATLEAERNVLQVLV